MSIQLSLYLSHAFVLRASDIERLWNVLATGIGPVSATAECADHATRTFDDLQTLTAFENSKAKQIRSLSLSAWSENSAARRHAEVKFRAEGALDPIHIWLSAKTEDPHVFQLREGLMDVLEGTKAWYYLISRYNFGSLLAAGLAFFWLIIFVGAPDNPAPRPRMQLSHATWLTVQLMLFLVGIGVLIWAASKLHNRYFPAGVFALGQGEARYHSADNVRWVVIIGFGISLLASVVAWFATGGAIS